MANITRDVRSLNPYAMIKNCAAAIEFYEKAFGAVETTRTNRDDLRIAHAELQVGDSVLMIADEYPEGEAMSADHFGGSPVSFFLRIDDCDMAYDRAVAAGAKSVSEPKNQTYGDRMAGVLDPFGYKWWLAATIKC